MQHTPPSYRLADLFRYFLYLGATGFGGPVALVNYMQRDLVERRKWITPEAFKEGLTLAQLAPGPLAAQLGIYLGYVHYGWLGATLAGIGFVLPSFIMVVLFGMVYAYAGGVPGMQAAFYGVGACVIGIIAVSAWKLTRKTVDRNPWAWGIYLTAAAVTVITETEHILLFLAAGLLYGLVKWQQRRGGPPPQEAALLLGWLPGLQIPLAGAAGGSTLVQMASFFLKAGAFVFGSGLAIVPFLYGGVVTQHHWLNDQQFMDAVAVAMISPGPVVITVAFIGYLVSGFPGACVAALGTFIPCYLFTVLPAPYFSRISKIPAVKDVVDGITTAAIGAIAGAVIVLGRRSVTDVPTALIALTAIGLMLRLPKLREPLLILGAAAAGLLLKTFWPG
ncbi:MAG: chromate transporter [Bacteroidia bacterium]|nr:chromate transporter [Bacteroidia bacterium]